LNHGIFNTRWRNNRRKPYRKVRRRSDFTRVLSRNSILKTPAATVNERR
jgi:hypothetical protein